MTTLRVTIWNEGRHEQTDEAVIRVYPNGMHAPIAQHLRKLGMEVRIATLDQPEHGLTEDVLEQTDVLTWWGHKAHKEVQEAVVDRVHKRVLSGMGLVVLHSGHHSKIFKRLMGTTCNLRYREINERERVWVVNPAHPIAAGLSDYFEIPHSEMYGEPFDVPTPDELVFISWFQGGEVFRSGCGYYRGRGKIFYFSPGHETNPIYYQQEVLHVIGNAVQWAAPTPGPKALIEKALHVPHPPERVVVE